MIGDLAVGYEQEIDLAEAKQLAEQLKLVIDNQAKQQLLVTQDKLCLKIAGFLPQFADFASKTWQKRRDAGKTQGLVKACKPVPGLKIIDATAGWGRDAAILASFGAQVLMLERQPIIAALLADGLRRQDEHSKKVLQLQLKQVDANQYLATLLPEEYPDIIYIDPMHPQRQKAALVKKDMQALQQLIGVDTDALALLELARSKVKKKVVVKWPQALASLLPPTTSFPGKTVRFDCYEIK